MKKSEQLKKAALFTVADINNPGKQMLGNHYFFTEFQLQEYASEIAREQREAITLKHAPDIKQREYIHSPAEEISIILDKYEASCPLERQEIIDEINARFIDIMNKPQR